jgi:hypothetical protein
MLGRDFTAEGRNADRLGRVGPTVAEVHDRLR